tara:strand:+ start:257 stop:751 length:495 start_codon:yes stop_codon:yes gene_type:complete
MNLRDKFIWNLVLFISLAAIAWNIWGLISMNSKTNISIQKYKNEEVGTDKNLESKVAELENIYKGRESMKFVMLENPVDLNNVVSMGSFSGTKRKGSLWVSGIISSSKGTPPSAIIRYKEQEYLVEKGDSIAGGIIEDITTTEVVFKKNDKIYTYYRGIDQDIE